MENLNLTWGGNFKSVTDQGILDGSGIVFGSELEPDLSQFKDFFTKDTYVNPEDSFTTTLFMEHCFSYDKPIGKAHMYKTDKGWEVTAELNMEDPVVKSRFPEIKSGGWGFSTGAVGHAVVREKKENGTHHIKQWAVGEISITKTPAEPKALIHNVKSIDEYYNPMIDESEDMESEDNGMNQMHDQLMEIIRALIESLTAKKVDDLKLTLNTELEEIKNLISEGKICSSCSANMEADKTCEKKPKNKKEGDENTSELQEELTVLKSVYEELLNSHNELQSSFNEKEALLSEKMALLSDIQSEIEGKNTLIEELELKMSEMTTEFADLNKRLEIAKEANRVLSKTN